MKTGLHLHGAGQYARIVDYYRRSGSKTVKFMNFRDIGLMNELKAMGVTIIYRLHTDDQSLGGNRSKDFIRDLVGKVQGTPIDFAEGYNEAHGDRGAIGRYAAHEIDRMKALEAVGKKAIIGNFSLGTPEITDGGKTWEEFRPALRHALSNGHALGLHSYAGPYMQYFTETPDGKNQWNNQTNSFTGISTDASLYWNPTLTGWSTLRYRKVYALFRTWGLGDLPLYITEGGIDNCIPRPGPDGRGYKDFQDGVWDRLPGIGDYAEQRRWYMWQASHDKYLKGVVDFGWQGTSTGWQAFDLETDPGMVERIIAREADLPITHHGAPSPPPPQPQPQPEQPMSPATPMPAKSYSSRGSTKAQYVIVHSTDTPAGGTPEATARYLADNDRQVSIHEFVAPKTVYIMVPDDKAAHHAGYGRLPNGISGGAVNAASWGIEIYQLHGQECDPALVERAAVRTADACRRLGIPWDKVLAHREIDPTRRSDPVGVNMPAFRGRVAELLGVVPSVPNVPPPTLDMRRLWIEADSNQVIHLNPAAGLQRAILGAGLALTSDEWEHSPRYVAQRAEPMAGGAPEVFVYDRETGMVTRHKRG